MKSFCAEVASTISTIIGVLFITLGYVCGAFYLGFKKGQT